MDNATAIARRDETLFRLGSGPLFPGIPDQTGTGVPSTDGSRRTVPLFRTEVAELVAIRLNAASDQDQTATRAQWYGDALVLLDGRYEHTPGFEPAVIRPDDYGRYLMPGMPWTQEHPSEALAGARDDHVMTALRILAHCDGIHDADDRDWLFRHVAGGRDADEKILARVHRAAEELHRQLGAAGRGNRPPVLCRECARPFPGLLGDAAPRPFRYCTEIPTRLEDFIPFFDVPAPFPLEHRGLFRYCGPGPCYCAPTTPEGEWLLSIGYRCMQIEELLATQGKKVLHCGSCNAAAITTPGDEEQFWAEHSPCPPLSCES
ncbi:hypothetical protein [Amycolatopsis sp. WGS_07]|uniref:hypothetical protein n=1 Tax=Amycolatopsis sp. WGS_07 TaxID=3076764 RepID=UPI0038731F65